MIDVKEATLRAKEFARETLGNSTFSLEEIERGEYKGRNVWMLTLGLPKAEQDLLTPGDAVKSMSNLFRPSSRAYKTFYVDSDTGEVIAMKIRDLWVPA